MLLSISRMVKELPGLWVVEALKRGGVDVPAVRREVPECVDEVLRDQQEVHPDLVNRLLDACARNSGDPDFGLHMARLITLDMLGPFGYVLQNASTVGRLLELAHRYYPVLYRGCEVEVSRAGGGIRFAYRSRLERSFSPRHLDEWTLGFFVERIRQAAGPDWHPTRVSMQYPRPEAPEEVYAWFGPRVRFGREGGSWFEVDEETLGCAFDLADDGVLHLAVDLAEHQLDGALRSSSFAGKARAQLADLVRRGEASAARLARRMAVSQSTLKRRLADEGTTFRSLRDEAVKEYASELLLRSELQVGSIAARLGYADISSFNRAFHRMSGMAPTAYRARERAGG